MVMKVENKDASKILAITHDIWRFVFKQKMRLIEFRKTPFGLALPNFCDHHYRVTMIKALAMCS